jgi:hypothetical protein
MFLVWLGAVDTNCGVLELVLVECSTDSPRCSSPGRWLGVAGNCGAANTPLHAVTVLLELLVTKLALIHSVAVLCTAMSTVNLYPVSL